MCVAFGDFIILDIFAEEEAPTVTSTTATKPQPQPVMNIENINVSDSSPFMVQMNERQTTEVPVASKSPIFIRFVIVIARLRVFQCISDISLLLNHDLRRCSSTKFAR